MKINLRFKIQSFLLATALLAGFGTHASAQQATVLIDLNTRTATRLGDLGGNYSEASAINDAGQVVGLSRTAEGDFHAFITGPDGMGMRDLGSILGGSSSASDINDAGQVVGVSSTEFRPNVFPHQRAFITGPDGAGIRDLGTLGGDRSFASGINDAGQVVGLSRTAEGDTHAFITGPDGMGMRDLGTLGGDYSAANGINDNGQVVGRALPEGRFRRPFRAFITDPNGTGMRDLGLLGGDHRNDFSVANDINDTGQVVGFSFTYEDIYEGPDPSRAFITGPNGAGMRELGTLGGNYSEANGINDAGQAVGQSSTAEGGASRAFITDADGLGMMNLNSLVDLQGAVLTRAIDINNNGQVVAIAVVSEPETYALMLAGLGLIGFMARRKKAENSETSLTLVSGLHF